MMAVNVPLKFFLLSASLTLLAASDVANVLGGLKSAYHFMKQEIANTHSYDHSAYDSFLRFRGIAEATSLGEEAIKAACAQLIPSEQLPASGCSDLQGVERMNLLIQTRLVLDALGKALSKSYGGIIPSCVWMSTAASSDASVGDTELLKITSILDAKCHL